MLNTSCARRSTKQRRQLKMKAQKQKKDSVRLLPLSPRRQDPGLSSPSPLPPPPPFLFLAERELYHEFRGSPGVMGKRTAMFQGIKHRLSQSNRCHECFSCVQGDAGRGEFCLQEAAESELGRGARRQATRQMMKGRVIVN